MKKAISLFLILAMALAMFSACTSGQTPPAAGNAAAPASSGAAPASSAPAAGGPKTEMVFANLIGGSNDLISELLAEEIKAFNESNPYNVTFKQEAYENEQYKTKQATLMASNAQPDAFFTWEAGYIRPFVEGDKVYPIGDKLLNDPEWIGRFPDQSVFGPLIFNDKIYAVPNTRQMIIVSYNKKMFADAGVEVPANYEEFLKVCEAIKGTGNVPLIIPCQQAWYGGQFLQQLANGIGGKDLYDAICDGTTTWEDPRFVEAAADLKNLADSGYLPSNFLSMSPNEAFEGFDTGKAAMFVHITSGFHLLENVAATDGVGFFLLPAKVAGNEGVNVGSIGQTYAVSSKAKNIDAACDMVKQLSDKNYQERLAYESGQIIVTNTPIDKSKINALAYEVLPMFDQITLYTPWFDRIFGAGEGVELNNAAVAVLAGGDPAESMKNLQQFAVDNATR